MSGSGRWTFGARRSVRHLVATSSPDSDATLVDGSRVAVIGGGPAGSLFAYFLLRTAHTIDLDISVDVYEPRHFTHCGPAGCNHCGGIVSESLVQMLATEGINLPPSVVQRSIYSYVLHMDAGTVEIESPAEEQRIAAIYRGNGPRNAVDMPWDSFDGYLQQICEKEGAQLVHQLVVGLERDGDLPVVRTAEGSTTYDLVAVACGVNSNFHMLLDGTASVGKPETTRTFISEFKLGAEAILETLGDSMHVFLLDIPRLEFAALIPKGDYVTLAMLGEEIDDDLVRQFLDSPEVREALPAVSIPAVCACAPVINVKGPERPFGERVVLIGDAGTTRLYKDGIGAAYRTAKAAAETAIVYGISAGDFERHYFPTCRAIEKDNMFGRLIFFFTGAVRKSSYVRKAVLRMTAGEQMRPRGRHMSGVLWNMFTGSAPYRDVFYSALHPGFLLGLVRSLAPGIRPSRKES
jgi:flavin-dependent dehydrogenase